MKEQQLQICLSKTKPVGSQSKQLEESQLMGPSNQRHLPLVFTV